MIKEINLLPWRLDLLEQKRQQFILMLVVGIMIVAMSIFSIHGILKLVWQHYEIADTKNKQKIAFLDQKLKEVQQIQIRQNKFIEQSKQLKNWQKQQNWLAKFFNELIQYLPAGVYLTELKREGHSVLISGRAEINAQVTIFVQAINRMSSLKNPSLKQMQTQSLTGFYDQVFTLQADEHS